MNMKKIYIIPMFILLIIFSKNVNAATYETTTNLFENTYTNNLIDMANTQINNFINKKYVILQNNYNYYLIAFDEYNLNNNTIQNSTIIEAIRVGENYNYTYNYNKKNEENTTININNIVVSNVEMEKSITGKRFNEYQYQKNMKYLSMFILGITFAIFITKERKY